MKKIYPLILSIVFGFSVKAQFTINATANPSIGDIENTWEIDTLGLQTGSSGTGQIWNFTTITITPSLAMQSNSHVATTAAPNNSLFPAACNMAQTRDGMEYSMFGYTTNSIVIYGSTNNTFTAVYQNPLVLATLPFTYGQISTDTYSSSFTYSGTPVLINGTVTTTGDAYGTLNTPGNTYPNVMRIKLQLNQNQVVNTQTVTTTSIDYVYLNTNGGFATKNSLLSINNSTQTVSGSTVVTKTKSGSVSNAVMQGIREQQKNAAFSIYPNPASNKEVTINFIQGNSENYSVNIYNSLGENVKKINFIGATHSEKINLNGLNSGIYFIKVKGNNTEGVQKLIIE